MVVSDSSEPSTKRRRCIIGEERTLGEEDLQSSLSSEVVESTAKLPAAPVATTATASHSINPMTTSKVCTIFIGGLHPRIMEAHIEKMCLPYGSIQRLHLCDRKGYAFCQFASADQATAAMQALDGRGLLGRRLMVRPAHSDQQQQQQSTGGGTTSASSGGVSSNNNNNNNNPNKEKERLEARIQAVKRKLQNAQSQR